MPSSMKNCPLRNKYLLQTKICIILGEEAHQCANRAFKKRYSLTDDKLFDMDFDNITKLDKQENTNVMYSYYTN